MDPMTNTAFAKCRYGRAVGTDALKDITLSTFKNNLVWSHKCQKAPSKQDKGKQPKPSDADIDDNKVKVSVVVSKGKRKSSDGKRHHVTRTPLRLRTPFTAARKRSHSHIQWADQTEHLDSSLRSRSADIRVDNESATRPRNRYYSGWNQSGPMRIAGFIKYKSSDVTPSTERWDRCSAKTKSLVCNRQEDRFLTDGLKGFTLSTFKNNIVWSHKYPDVPSSKQDKEQQPQKVSEAETEDKKVNTAAPASKGKRKSSDDRRPVSRAPSRLPSRPPSLTAGPKRSPGLSLMHRLRTLSTTREHNTELPRCAPPQTLLSEPDRKMRSSQIFKSNFELLKKHERRETF
ncbi:uncharacterized protein LOC134451220 [Engraulis encrasicolus]|uniref:uncharacterized protein LOC134451220 n=1 Tax=Engraulis encrasicolus TaxID=184585 RepID=UPI002FD119B2